MKPEELLSEYFAAAAASPQSNVHGLNNTGAPCAHQGGASLRSSGRHVAEQFDLFSPESLRDSAPPAEKIPAGEVRAASASARETARLGAPHDEENTVRVEAARSEPPPLFNAREPAYLLQAERPVHRAIIWLAAQGLSYVEIAERLGVSPPMVHYVTKQPWAEEAILQAIHQNGGDAVAAVLQAEALPSVKKLIQLRDDAEAPREVQRKSANDLLDRLFGKCVQPIVHQQADLEQLSDKELQELVSRGRAN